MRPKSIERDEHFDRYTDACGLRDAGAFAEAFYLFDTLARCDHLPSMSALASMFLRGQGVPADAEKGLALYRKATEMGGDIAAYNLGAIFRTGAYGVKPDASQSRQYFLIAKQLGCPFSVEDFL